MSGPRTVVQQLMWSLTKKLKSPGPHELDTVRDDSHRRLHKGVTVENCRNRLLFSGRIGTMRGSSHKGLQLAFDRFCAACDQEATKISSKTIEVLCLIRRPNRPVASGGAVVPCPPVLRLAPWLLHTSNTVFQICGPPSGFWPPCCYILATGLRPRQCFLQVSGTTLQHVEAFK